MGSKPLAIEDNYGNVLRCDQVACEDHEVRLMIHDHPVYLNKKLARDLIVHLLEHPGLFG